MIRSTDSLAWQRAVALVALGIGVLALGAVAHAQDDAPEVEKITPYTGPPIFLDESEPAPPATLVERKVVSDKYDDGTIRTEREIARYSDDRRAADGIYREYFPNGQLFVEGQYRDGAQHGEWTYWHENGTKSRTANYKNGKPDGSWEVHRADGTLEAKRAFKDGKRDGTWITYDETGEQPLSELHYTDGKYDGVMKFWFPNGQLQRQIGFKMGVRHGDALEWDEEGNQRIEAAYDDGKPHGTATAWASDGRKFVQEFDHGKLISRSQE